MHPRDDLAPRRRPECGMSLSEGSTDGFMVLAGKEVKNDVPVAPTAAGASRAARSGGDRPARAPLVTTAASAA